MPPKGNKKLGKKVRGPKPRAPKGIVVARPPRRPSSGVVPSAPKLTGRRAGSSGSAPAAVSVMKSMHLNFSGSNAGRHLRTSALLPMCQIGTDLFTNGLVLSTGANTSASAAVALLNPQYLPASQKDVADPPTFVQGRWLSPQLSLICQAFDRYRPIALEFVYEPQAATSTVDRLVFSYAQDPAHPVLSGYAGSGSTFATVPTQTDLLITPDSVAFAPWMPWRLTVPMQDFGELFVAGKTSVSASGIIESAGSLRTCFAGLIACRSAAAVTAVTYGVLFARVVFDLVDPVPSVQSATPALLRVRPEAAAPPSSPPSPSESKKPRPSPISDDEEWNQPPPTFRPMASAVPGSATYVAPVSKTPSQKGRS